jgi:SAM-dependent methyltransferase
VTSVSLTVDSQLGDDSIAVRAQSRQAGPAQPGARNSGAPCGFTYVFGRDQVQCFDIVVASLVLHYVRDWTVALRELRRVLGPRGAVVFSTHHPTMDWMLVTPDDYFAVKQMTDTWRMGGRGLEVTFWGRSGPNLGFSSSGSERPERRKAPIGTRPPGRRKGL